MEENDNELLYLIGEHSEEAMDILYNKYKHIIDKIVNKYMKFTYNNNKGIDKNDLSQEAMISCCFWLNKKSNKTDNPCIE